MRLWLARNIRLLALLALVTGIALQVPLVLGGHGWPVRVAQSVGLIAMSMGIGILVSSSAWGRRRRAIYEQTRAHERELGEQQARQRRAREQTGDH